ncbi:MAG: flippase [Gemmatimonadota bacterium]|nr:flippase [Gemmatimonadota bacterium]
MSSLNRNFLALALGEATARLIAFAASVYLARTLGPAGYGILGVATAVMLYVTAVGDAGIDLIGVREIAAHPVLGRELGGSLVASRALIATVVAFIVIVAGVFLAPQPEGAILASYSLTLLVLGANTRWIHLGLEQGGRVAAGRIVGEAVMAAFVLSLVHSAGDIPQVPLAQFLGDAVAALCLAWWLRGSLGPLVLRFDWHRAGPILRRGTPLVLQTLLGLLIFNSDLIFLRLFHSATVTGLYVAAYTLVSFLVNVGIAYGQSLLPALTRLGADPHAQGEQYRTSLAQVFAVGLPIAVGGAVLAPEIIGLAFGHQYQRSALPLAVLLWSVPAGYFRNVSLFSLVACGRQDLVLRTAVQSAILNLVLNLVLIPEFAMLGAAAATVLTELVRAGLAVRNASLEGLRPPGVGRFWRAMVAVGAMALILLPLAHQPLWVSLPAGVATFALVLSLTGGLRLSLTRLPSLHV